MKASLPNLERALSAFFPEDYYKDAPTKKKITRTLVLYLRCRNDVGKPVHR